MPGRTTPLDKLEEAIYKAAELYPLAKIAVGTGRKTTERVIESAEYLAHLTEERDLEWMGYNKKIRLMDIKTASTVKNHPTLSKMKKDIAFGVAGMFGEKLIDSVLGPSSMIGSASAIASVERTDDGKVEITRKKQLGLKNKQPRELIDEFHSFDRELLNEEQVESEEDIIPEEREVEIMRELKRRENKEQEIMQELTLKSDEETEKKLSFRKPIEMEKDEDGETYKVPWRR